MVWRWSAGINVFGTCTYTAAAVFTYSKLITYCLGLRVIYKL